MMQCNDLRATMQAGFSVKSAVVAGLVPDA